MKHSDCEIWIGIQSKRIGRFHRNAYIQVLKDFFDLGVLERGIAENPAAHLKYRKRERPIRLAPTWEEFLAIVKDIRTQRFNADAEDSADFIGCSGLGVAEAGGISKVEVDRNHDQIRVYRHKTDQGFVIPIFPQLRPLLEKLYDRGSGVYEDELLGISSATQWR